MSITSDEIDKIAYLARLQIQPDERDQMRSDITRILSMIDQMQSVDTEGVEPLAHPFDHHIRLRKDEVTEPNQRETLMANAKSKDAGLFLVPKVIE